MSELVFLEPQDNFPKVDLTLANTDLLELMFQNVSIFDQMHRAAEQASSLYKVGHKALVAASRPHVIQHEADALSHGAGTYEAIAKLVAPIERAYHNTMLARTHIEMAYLAINLNFDEQTNTLPALFRNHLPNTSRVVEAAADRVHGGAIDFAIIGAALAYRLDMGASVEQQKIQDGYDEHS